MKKNLNILESHKKLLNIEVYKKDQKRWEKLKISENKKYEMQKLKKLCFFRENQQKKISLLRKLLLIRISILCRKTHQDQKSLF